MTRDVVFIVDNTGSMSGYIDKVKSNVTNFINNLQSSRETYRFGLVEFGDNGDSEIKTYDFTDDAETFVSNVNAISLTGGGDYPESGLEALETALSMVSDSDNSKYFIVVTDASYHNSGESGDGDSTTFLTTSNVINDLTSANVTVNVIGEKNSYYYSYSCESEWTPIAEATGGKFYDIIGDFPSIFNDMADDVIGRNRMHVGRHWGYSFDSTTVVSSSSDLSSSTDLFDNGEFAYHYGQSDNETISSAGSNDIINLYGVTLSQITGADISAGAVNLTFNDGGSLTVLGQNNSQYLLEGVVVVANQDSQTWSLKN